MMQMHANTKERPKSRHPRQQIDLVGWRQIGRYPKAVKLGPRTTVWRVSDIRALIEAE